MNCLFGLFHFLLNALPWALLFCLPFFLGGLLARMIWGGNRQSCIDCEDKFEGLRSSYAQRDRQYRELQQEASRLLNADR